MDTKIKVSDFLAEFLYDQGITHIFEVIGGMITHLIDSIHKQGKIRLVSVHHEQAAAFAAEGFSRMSGVPGIALATSGPGAINMLTSIGSCYFDSIPSIFITGQVNRHELKGSRSIRQLGFQEADIISMAAPVTKAAWQIQNPDDVPSVVRKAFELATSGRPGPVVLDIPMDVQRSEVCLTTQKYSRNFDIGSCDNKIFSEVFNDLRNAARPIVLAGGGINSGNARNSFREFIDLVKIPVVNSLMAVDVLPYEHQQRAGLIGSYGNRWVNQAVGKADLILVLGSRLDIRQTGSQADAFKGEKIIYHVDCEEGEINNRVKKCKPIVTQLNSFLTDFITYLKSRELPDYYLWIEEISSYRKCWPDTEEIHGLSGINPNQLMHSLSKVSNKACAFVVDVGQHQMWAAQSIEVTNKQRFLTSGGMGAMGFALPAAVGVSFSRPDEPVVVIAGDGGFQLNIQELETVAHHKLPVKMIVLNNKCYGMVRQFQQSYFKEKYPSTYWGYSAPDFKNVALSYGINSRTINDNSEIMEGLDSMWENPQEPFVLQVMLDPLTNVYPKIAFGLPITEMEPLAKPVAMDGN
jgi:acetolactate synthase I/II/III large subunit